MTYGFVYLMANPSMPGLYKIGMTERSPHLRAQGLSSTGVPKPFEVLCYIESDRMEVHEREMHEAMADFRESRNREFFRFTGKHMPWVHGLFRCHHYCLSYTECAIFDHLRPDQEVIDPWDGTDGITPTSCPYAPEGGNAQ